jgi:hypothetical protein
MVRTAAVVLAVLALPALGRAAEKPSVAVTPFNGKDLTGWKFKGDPAKSKWVVGYASVDPNDPRKLVVAEKGEGPPQLICKETCVDLYTEETFGDCIIEVEFMIPKGSNSGVYVHGEYEVQILDSYGKEKVGPGDLGGLYGAAAPKTNASKKPGEWQKFVIDFTRANVQADGKGKTSNAVFNKITLNGTVIHENVEMKGPTPSGVTGKEAPRGPLMFQGNHGPVAFRNIKITPKAAK